MKIKITQDEQNSGKMIAGVRKGDEWEVALPSVPNVGDMLTLRITDVNWHPARVTSVDWWLDCTSKMDEPHAVVSVRFIYGDEE